MTKRTKVNRRLFEKGVRPPVDVPRPPLKIRYYSGKLVDVKKKPEP